MVLSAGRGGKEGGGGRERRWSGRRWPWKKMSSAGERSMVGEGIDDVRDLGVVWSGEGWKVIVKENS